MLCYLKKGGASEVHLGIIRPDRPQIIKVRNDLNVSHFTTIDNYRGGMVGDGGSLVVLEISLE